jgi:hypothetical protein
MSLSAIPQYTEINVKNPARIIYERAWYVSDLAKVARD